MSIEEQEEEIAELEEESRRLRGVDEGIRRAAMKRLEGVVTEIKGDVADDNGAMET